MMLNISSPTKMIAFYLRLSDEDKDLRSNGKKIESYSISNQRKLLQEYYDTHSQLSGYSIAEFCDDGYSGTNFDRPQFSRMMELVRAGEVACILVKDLSRFGREYLEVSAYLELILPLFRTRFISVNDNFDSDAYAGTTGGLELALRNLINSLYSQDISIKIKSANRVRNKQGKYWGGCGFYGYNVDPKNKHRLIVDENVRPIITRIFTECADGITMAETARRLNDEGIPSPLAYKMKNGGFYNGRVLGEPIWMSSTLRRILSDERYTGKMVCGTREAVSLASRQTHALPREQWIIVENTHEAIISEELFQRAAESKKQRIRTINKNTAGCRDNNLFVCGCCGHKLQRSVGKTIRLFCPQSRNQYQSRCSEVSIEEKHLQGAVLSLLRTTSRVLVEKLGDQLARFEREASSLARQLEEKEKRLQFIQNNKLAMYEDYREGRMSRDIFMAKQQAGRVEKGNLTTAIEHIKKQIWEESREAEKAKLMQKTTDEIRILKEYDPAVVRKLVSIIKVYPGNRIELELRNRDEFGAILQREEFDRVSVV